ncbi:MAG: ion channel [Xenococcaceae cyanobacterium]
MKLIQWQKFSQKKYTHLLWALILLFLLFSLLEQSGISTIVIALVFFATIFLVIRTFYLPKKVRYFFLFLAVFSLLSDIVAVKGESIPHLVNSLYFASSLIDSLFMTMTILLLMRRIFLYKKVTADTIQGGISVYLLIGLLWLHFYQMIYIIDSDAFSVSIEQISSYELAYFSFTTLTTLGYGDISPVNRLAMALANIEALIGQMYPAVFIARLVSLYTTEETNEED